MHNKYSEIDDSVELEEWSEPKEIHSNSNHNSSAKDGIIPNTDDITLPALTLRVLVIGSFWCIFLAIVNAVFSFRTTAFGIPGFISALLSYPMGIFLARILPRGNLSIAGITVDLNPGPFSIKEHVLAYIIASGGSGLAYGIDNVVVQKLKSFMGNHQITIWESLLWVLSSQFLGFGMAGIMRRFLVTPPSMVWPQCLTTVALFIGFHETDSDHDSNFDLHLNNFKKYLKLTRYQFFWLAFTGMFLYSWLPLYVAPLLQSISILCVLTTNSRIRFLSSGRPNFGGVGLFNVTLDWSQISSMYLTSPWWAIVNWTLGNILWGWILTPIFYYSNAFGMDSFLNIKNQSVLNTAALFNRNGTLIQAVSLYNKTFYDLDESVYAANYPIYISSSFALAYGSSFLSIVAAFVHVFLWHGKDIYLQLRQALYQMDDTHHIDVHNRLMKNYPDIPEWKYGIFLILCVIIQIIVSLVTPFSMPIWAVFLCVFMALASILPIGVISAISGSTLGLNVLTEFVIGLLIPGKTVAVMTFKSLGTNSVIQAIDLLKDLKIGHYMKINPIHMVFCQLYGTLLGSIFNTLAAFFVMENMNNILGSFDWEMSNYSVFYNAGAIWGAIGPQRFFGLGSIYQNLLWAFPLGVILPLIPWLGSRRYHSKYWKLVNIPLLCSFSGPGRIQNTVVSGLIIGWIFQRYVYRNYPEWWKKYNYIMAIGFDSGVGITGLLVAILQQNEISYPIWMLNPTEREGYCFAS